ncbi:MAG: ABC transporter substrate-binding protein [Gammaproteobacteria bacterium]|nr:ABC transporter substrate-binding protein [Gammaproteobacteria bacterium]MCP5199780.1 ABC transporter substrate-binding protein [Gammaproteobacteria bacterium]
MIQPGCRAPLRFPVLLAVLLCAGAPLASASAGEPHELVSAVIERVMARLGEFTDEQAQNGAVNRVFEEELSPHLAFGTIARWLSGPRWATFSEADREELTAVIHDHIVQVYSSLLAYGRDVTIVVDPHSTRHKSAAKVAAVLTTPDKRSFDVEFRLLESPHGWLLYDLVADGVSFARTMQAELGPVITADGVPGVRAYLARTR